MADDFWYADPMFFTAPAPPPPDFAELIGSVVRDVAIFPGAPVSRFVPVFSDRGLAETFIALVGRRGAGMAPFATTLVGFCDVLVGLMARGETHVVVDRRAGDLSVPLRPIPAVVRRVRNGLAVTWPSAPGPRPLPPHTG